MSSQALPVTASEKRHASEPDNDHRDHTSGAECHRDDGLPRQRETKFPGKTRVSLDRETLADSGVGSEEPGETFSVAGDDIHAVDQNNVLNSKPSRRRHEDSVRGEKTRTSGRKSHDTLTRSETVTPPDEEVGWGGGVDGRKSGSDSAVSVTSSGTNWPPSLVARASADSRLAAFSSPTMSEGSKVSASSSPQRRPSSPKRSRSPELSRSVRLRQERRRREQDLQETRASLRKHQIGEKSPRFGPGKSMSETESGAKLLEKIMAASNKQSFHSIGTIRSMEQRYGRKSHRSRGERNKVSRSYESKSTSPTPITEPYSENRTKVGFSRSIQNHPASRSSGRRSKSLEKLAAARASRRPVQTELSSPRGEHPPGSSTLRVSRSFPSPPPSTSSPRGPLESTDLDESFRENSAPAATSNGNHSTKAATKYQSSSSRTEASSSSASGVSRSAPPQVESLASGAVASAAEVERKTNMATDAILRDGLPDIPPLEAATETCLLDWRAVFRVEMMRLRREVNDFRQFCQGQIKLHASLVEKSLSGGEASGTLTSLTGHRPQDGPRLGEQLKDLEQNMQLYQKKQQVLDLETELLAKEEQLSERQRHLEEYEREILEVESMLNQRQAICDRRQKALFTLDEELQTMRQELEETREHMHSDGSIPESSSEKARRNWDMVRRNLMDKQQLLETTVQKYRSELAAATSTIAGKDILISRLQGAAMENEEELNRRERRIQQLESKLTLTLSEARQLAEKAMANSNTSGSNHINLSGSNSGAVFRDSMSSAGHSRRGSTAAGGSSSVTFGDGGSNTGAEFTSPFAARLQSSNHQSSADGPSESQGNPYRLSFRGNAMYRRPSNNTSIEQGDDYGGIKPMAEQGGSGVFSSGAPRMSRKRNSVSDNAISRLTLSTPRTDDKFGRGSSACVVQ